MREEMAQALNSVALINSRPRITGSRLGLVVSVEDDNGVTVTFEGNVYGPLRASQTDTVRGRHLQEKSQVLLLFADGDPRQPVIIDTMGIAPNAIELPTNSDFDESANEAAEPPEVDAVSETFPAQFVVAKVSHVEARELFVKIGPDGAAINVKTAVSLRNLHDDVLMLCLPGESFVVIGQLSEDVMVPSDADASSEVKICGETVVIEATKSLLLDCGPNKVSLENNGRVSILGKNVVTRSTGVTKVQGACVQIN